MTDRRTNTPPTQRGWNPLMEFFRINSAPKIEYVFNSYHRPYISKIHAIAVAIDQDPATTESDQGDGVVATFSAAGKTGAGDTNIWNGTSNPNGPHDIDPVIFGVWDDTDHSAAMNHTLSLMRSLVGVPYQWPGNSPSDYSDWPRYARSYNEHQAFNKYFSTPASGTTAFTDEPGIGDVKMLDILGGGENPMVIPAIDTWSVAGGIRQKTHTNDADFAGHQIMTISGFGTVTALGTVGTKNNATTPMQFAGTNSTVVEGNEYLPTSVRFNVANSPWPIPPITYSSYGYASDDSFEPFATVLPTTQCLARVELDGSIHQYGVFTATTGMSSPPMRMYQAHQGQNLAGLLTPQAERAFDAPVDSATVVAILRKINQGEALTNACFTTPTITHWTANVQEWLKTDTGTITLNFFPTSTNVNLRDAWTSASFTDFTYNANSKLITINDTNAAPSQLIASNAVYVGCDQSFTTNYAGVSGTFTVTALGSDTLAGVPVDQNLLAFIRGRVENILPRFLNTSMNICMNWTLPTILAAVSNNSGAWSPVTNGLVTVAHFTELTAVLDHLDVNNLANCYLKDNYVRGGYAASVTIPEDVYVCNVTPITNEVSYCWCIDDGSGMGTGYNSCDGSFCFTSEMPSDQAGALSNCLADVSNFSPDCSCDATLYSGEVTRLCPDCYCDGTSYTTNSITDCSSFQSVAATLCSPHCIPGGAPYYSSANGTFNLTCLGGSFPFWHGSPPCPSNACYLSSDGTNTMAINITWTFGNTTTDTVNSAYICTNSTLILTNCTYNPTTYP